MIAAVVALGIAATGGVAIYAASGSVDSSQTGPGGKPGPMMGGPMLDLEAQHGEFHIGEVAAVTADSITVKSKDGYERTYVLGDDTEVPDRIEEGAVVTVIATTENGIATASAVLESDGTPNGRAGSNRGARNGEN